MLDYSQNMKNIVTKQREDLNALKGIAIVAIVAYHFFVILNSLYATNITYFNNGFLGVDVFLVISGYLITAGIVKKLSRFEFNLKEFYTHRLLRIIPPLVIMCFITMLIGYFLIYDNVFLELGKETISALLFVSNFFFASSGGYFSFDSSDKLLMHTWYLAITIQFYVIHPLVLMALSYVFGRRRLAATFTIVWIFGFFITLAFSSDGNGYLVTQHRIWELGVGGLAFFYKKKISKLLFENRPIICLFAEVIGLLLIVLPFILEEQHQHLWFVSSSIYTVLGTALIILVNREKSLLNIPPLCFIGKYSYSLYLWHWPVFIFIMRAGYSCSVNGAIAVIAVVLTVTFITYQLFEKKKFSTLTTLILYAITLATAVAVVYYNGQNFMTKHEINSSKVMVQPDIKLKKVYKPTIFLTENNVPVYKLGAQTLRPFILFIGDSHAEHYAYYLRNINKAPMYFMFMHATVGYGSNFSNYKVKVVSTHEERQTFNKIYHIMLETMKDGDEIVLANRWDVYYTYYLREHELKDSDENFDVFLKAMIEDFDEEIKNRPNLHFNIIGQGVTISQIALNCMKYKYDVPFMSKIYNSKKCRLVDNVYPRMNRINEAFKAYAKTRPNVRIIDRNIPLKISKQSYRTVNSKGLPLYYDKTHYSTAGGNIVGKYIIKEILKNRTTNPRLN